jgi:Protein of unknown function (DUF1579)
VTITPFHMALHDFVGTWDVSQRIWNDPKGPPQVHAGHCGCQLALDGTATIMSTDVPSSKNKGVSIISYSTAAARYELAWLDSSGAMGLCLMYGRPDRRPSRAEIRSEFGKSAMQEREWFSTQASLGQCAPETLRVALPEFGMRLVENKVSGDHWVLDFFFVPAEGPDHLVMQNVFTRTH